MKVFKYSLLALLLSCNSNKQKETSDADDSIAHVDKESYARQFFVKCSYVLLLKGRGNDNAFKGGNATGFFIKKDSRTLLVSCYHVFTSSDTRKKHIDDFSMDSLIVVYHTLSGYGQITIDLGPIRKKNPPIYDYQRADIFAYDVTDLLKKDAEINSVEQYFRPITSKTIPSDIFSTGYGGGPSMSPTNMKLHWIDSSFDSYSALYESGLQKVTNSYLVYPATMQGMSGSPVFFELNNNPDSIFFEGVVATHFANANKAVIVKPDEVEREIERVIHKN